VIVMAGCSDGWTELVEWRSIDGSASRWSHAGGELEVVPGTGDLVSTSELPRDFELDLEFWIPIEPADWRGQDRGNSGVYLHGRYEIQVLDSWENETEPNAACGALYGVIAPRMNASKPPGEWQRYEITFRMPGAAPGELTVVHNGVTIIERGAFATTTGGALDDRVGVVGPLRLQEHGHAVRYRNLRVRPL
jgi:hypothetical protein